MSSNLVNQVAYIRTSRAFPTDPQELSVQLSRTYIDLATAINSRIIGIFTTNKAAINGEEWFLSGNRKQQGFRQVYQFTAAGNIPHNLSFSSISAFTKCTGSFTDGTNWYGVIFGSNVAIAGQLSFYITSTNIVVLAGAGAPVATRGIIILEWLSQP